MAPYYKGSQFSSDNNVSYDQENGFVYQIVEEGIPSAIFGRMNGWKNQGYNVEISQNGTPYARGVATKNRFTVDYNYVERWGISTELIQKPIWSLPEVQAEMDSFNFVGPLAVSGAKAYRQGIQDAVSEGRALYGEYGPYPVASKVYLELIRGADSYEHDYAVLTRTVSFDFLVPPAPLQLESNRYIYETAELISNENIPVAVQFQLPQSEPSTEPDSMWGWRIRDQSAEITNATTGTHTTSWVYAQWSKFLYTEATP